MRVGGTPLPENERPLVSGFRRKSGDAASELGDFLGAYVEVRRCLKAPVPDTQFVSVAISVPVKANLKVQAHVHTLPVMSRREKPSRLLLVGSLGFISPRPFSVDYLRLTVIAVYSGFHVFPVARARSDVAPPWPTVFREFKRRFCFRKC